MLHPYYWSNDCCICMMLLFWHTQCNRWDLYLRGSHCWGLPCPLDPIVSPPTYAPRVILFCHKGLWSDTLTESIILPWIERSYPHQWCEEFTNEASCLFSMCHWMYRQPHLERRKTWNIFSDSQSSFAVNQKYLVLFISQRKWYTWEVQVMQNLKTGHHVGIQIWLQHMSHKRECYIFDANCNNRHNLVSAVGASEHLFPSPPHAHFHSPLFSVSFHSVVNITLQLLHFFFGHHPGFFL